MPVFNNIKRSCLALAISQTITLSAQAAVINVTNNGDDSIGCTLREAIRSANSDFSIGNCTAGDGADIITFNGIPDDSTITLTQGQLFVTSEITVNGLGQDRLTINGNNASRVFYVDAFNYGLFGRFAGELTLNDITISGGSLAPNTGLNGAGIMALGRDAKVSINNATVSGNTANRGGGISFSGSSLTLNNSTVSSNSAFFGGGGIHLTSTTSSTTISNSSISGNYGYEGGGIHSYNSNIDIVSSTISGNSAGRGGGVYSEGSNANIINSTIIRKFIYRPIRNRWRFV